MELMLPRHGDQEKYAYAHVFHNYFDFYTELITYIDCTFITCIRRDVDYRCLRQLHIKDSNKVILCLRDISQKIASENSICKR